MNKKWKYSVVWLCYENEGQKNTLLTKPKREREWLKRIWTQDVENAMRKRDLQEDKQ